MKPRLVGMKQLFHWLFYLLSLPKMLMLVTFEFIPHKWN